MDVGSVISAALVGGFSYDLVKTGLKLSVQNIMDLTREKAIDWLYDEEATEKIARRINELGCNNESQEQYKQRLDSDVVLNELLKQLSQKAAPVAIIVDNSENTRVAGRDYNEHNNHTHHHSPESKEKKS